MHRAPLFVIGYPRSGTTLLRAVLGMHSRIHLVHEPELIRGMRAARYAIGDVVRQTDRQQFLEKIQAVDACRRHLAGVPASVLARFASDSRDLSLRDAYELLLPRPDGQVIWGEKSLGNVFCIRELHEMYPEALFVHIVRDPRAALLSYYRKRFAHSNECVPRLGARDIRFFMSGALQWESWVSTVREARAELGPKAILELRFEDLVSRPEYQVARICRALGVQFDEGMLDAARRQQDPVLRSSGAFGHQRLRDPIDSSRAKSHTALPAWADRLIERFAGTTMVSHGYTLNLRPVGLLDRLRVTAEVRRSERNVREKLERVIARRQGFPAGVPES